MMPRPSVIVLLFGALLLSSCTPDEETAAPESTLTPGNSTSFVVVDEAAFREILPSDAEVVQLATGLEFVEGPLWIDRDGGFLDVYRYDEGRGVLTAVVTDAGMPNGLCFSPDESVLYVADSGDAHHIRAFAVGDDGSLSGGDVFATLDQGAPDGIRCDERGNVWSSSGDGAQVFSPDGSLIVRILLPESAANLAFGGADGHTVYFTARTSLYAVPTLVGDAHAR
jgi:sugar lactone lactonase YvrE